MTIASEITRLQNDKAAICTAIENKGVTVGSVKLDDYAACIDAIEQGGGNKSAVFLLVGGGGGGGGATCCSASSRCGAGGGGGAGGVMSGDLVFTGDNLCVVVGNKGSGGAVNKSGNGGFCSCIYDVSKGVILKYVNGGGGGGTAYCGLSGCSGGSGGGAGSWQYDNTVKYGGVSSGRAGQMGNDGGAFLGTSCHPLQGGGGGGATSSGIGNVCFSNQTLGCYVAPGWGGKGFEGTWGGKTMCIAGGGGGGSYQYPASCKLGCGRSGGGNGGTYDTGCYNGKAATTCGSGGGGGAWRAVNCCGTGGAGGGGLVIIGYNCECKECNGFTCATGGNSCYVCNGMKYHCFTSSGTFCIVS